MDIKKKVLIIEDEKSLAKALEIKIKEQGHEVIIAIDGKDGLKLVKKENPDLIILDLILPKMPGEQILKEMNEDGSIDKIPVLVVSNKADSANAQNCLKIWKAKDYLIKSDNSLEEIIIKVNKLLK
jgi:DNA-binding response OmpR family regulator